MSPLNQLNLVLWMTWPRPAPAGGIRPLLYDRGYRVWGIGPRLSVDPSQSTVARRAGVLLKESVAPEVILRHNGALHCMTVECKLSGFGPDPDPNASERSQRGHQSRQATSLLVITGDRVAKHAGFDTPEAWDGSLLYLIGEGEEARLETTLRVLETRIANAGLPSQRGSAVGLYQRDDGLYFVPASGLPQLGIANGGGLRVMETEGEDAGDVLQLVPLLPYDTSVHSPTETQKLATEERLRSAVASLIGRRIGRHPFTFTLEDVLRESVEVWDVWRDDEPKRKFKRVTRAYVKSVVAGLGECVRGAELSLGVAFVEKEDEWQWESVGIRTARAVRRALASAAFQRGRIDLWKTWQGDLFDPQ